MGRKSLPTNMKIVKGTLRPSRQVKNEAKAELLQQIPKAPNWICDEGLIEWGSQVKFLINTVMSERDLSMFAMYCQSWGKYIELTREINEHGETSVGEKGVEYEHPRSYLSERHRKAALQVAAHFGLTPSSRTGISTIESKKNNPLDELMKNAK
jgi:P27 family predicted phage terminase small subunit